jgi:hypothetical protein
LSVKSRKLCKEGPKLIEKKRGRGLQFNAESVIEEYRRNIRKFARESRSMDDALQRLVRPSIDTGIKY